MHLTAYTSPDQARSELQMVQALLAVLVFVALVSQFFVSLAADFNKYLAIFLMIGDLIFFAYVVLYCRNIIKKTKQVSLAQIGLAMMFLLAFAAAPFALVLAPICYMWFVMPLIEPLEIIAGNRKPPENLQNIEQRRMINKNANQNAMRTIVIISFIIAAILITLSYLEIRGQGIRF